MRSFVLYSRRGKTSGNFDIENLSSEGRMDLICRCISSSMFLSYKKRENTRVYVVLNGPPNPPITVCFTENSNFYPDERSTAKLIKKILSSKIEREWKEVDGVMVAKKSFQEIVSGLAGNLYILHEKGKPIKHIKENPVFILGDNIGIPKKEENRILEKGEKISLGKTKYLTSSCIAVLNWLCDNYEVD